MLCRCIKRDGKPCNYKAKANTQFCGVHTACKNVQEDVVGAASTGKPDKHVDNILTKIMGFPKMQLMLNKQ